MGAQKKGEFLLVWNIFKNFGKVSHEIEQVERQPTDSKHHNDND